MSAALQSLASRRLAIGRERALKAQRELAATFDLLLLAEREHNVVFPWSWREYQTRLRDEKQCQEAGYLDLLAIEAVAHKTNAEVLEKALRSMNERLKVLQDTVAEARREIEVQTQKHNKVLGDAKNVLADDQGGRHIKLPAKNIPSPLEGTGCFFGVVSGFFFGGLTGGIVSTFFPDREKGLILFVCMSSFYFFPQLIGYVVWRVKCRNSVRSANISAAFTIRVENQQFQDRLPRLQQQLAEAERTLRSSGLAQTAIHTRLQAAGS
ncbi:MAG: hypothetical protein ABMA13_01955 [Chthoniobacteraceae bacterium]